GLAGDHRPAGGPRARSHEGSDSGRVRRSDGRRVAPAGGGVFGGGVRGATDRRRGPAPGPGRLLGGQQLRHGAADEGGVQSAVAAAVAAFVGTAPLGAWFRHDRRRHRGVLWTVDGAIRRREPRVLDGTPTSAFSGPQTALYAAGNPGFRTAR